MIITGSNIIKGNDISLAVVLSLQVMVKDIEPNKVDHEEEIFNGRRTMNCMSDNQRINRVMEQNPGGDPKMVAEKVLRLCQNADYHYKFIKDYF